MRLTRRHFLATLCGLPLIPGHVLAGPSAPFALTGTIIPGNGTAPLTDHAVLIKADRITAVLPDHQLPETIPVRARGFILPGVINAHTHDLHTPEERRERHLLHGVTSIGDCASPFEALGDLPRNPLGRTATAACSGPMLCPPGGYPQPVHHGGYGLPVTSPDHGQETVRRLADAGATMIKIAFEPGTNPRPWPLFEPHTAGAICDEARRSGLTIRCHVQDLGGLEPALNAGVHTIEHVPHRCITPDGPTQVLKDSVPTSEYVRLLERMVQDGVIMTPTLDVLSRSIWNGPELFAPVSAFRSMGGRIALGNDFPFRRTDAGMPIREMELLAKAGLSPLEIVTAATSGSAAACGFADRGVVAPGMKADLLVTRSNPLKNLTAMNPTHILKDGVFVA